MLVREDFLLNELNGLGGIVRDMNTVLDSLNDRLTKLALRVVALERPESAGCGACEDPEALFFEEGDVIDDHSG